jgi:excisionase family DNA binding protein
MKRRITQQGIKRQKQPEVKKPFFERDVLTPREVARATGIGVLSIYDLLKSGELPSRKIGKRYYVSGIVYREWLAGFGRSA